MSLQDRNALVTGAGSGLGRALALQLAMRGARVAACGRRLTALQQTAESAPGSIFPFVLDVTSSVEVEEGVDAILAKLGSIDVLINNAAVFPPKCPVESLAVTDWDRAMVTNVRGPFLLMRKIIPLMKQTGWGRVLNISAPLKHLPGAAAYCASKCALDSLTKAAAYELRGTGVLVNAVEPPMMDTEMHQGGAAPSEVAPRILEWVDLPDDGPTGRVVKIESSGA